MRLIVITTEAGRVHLNVEQIVSVRPCPVRRNGATAHIRMADGEQFDTREEWQEVMDMLLPPKPVAAPAPPAPTPAAAVPAKKK